MRVFVSYAREQRAIADRIAIGLRQAGDRVFFDKDALPPGQEYDERILKEIGASDLFVFLVSPESVTEGTYALSELAAARRRWPAPSGHVLPVEVAPVSEPDAIPPYLRAVGILKAEGDLVSETLGVVGRIRSRRRRRFILAGLAAAVLTAASVTAAFLALPRIRSTPGTSSLLSGKVSDATTGAGISGATVKVQSGPTLLGEARSDLDGSFQIALEGAVSRGGAASRGVNLLVEHPEYSPTSRVVEAAAPTSATRQPVVVELLPRSLGHCLQGAPHAVLVGRFSGTSSKGAETLSESMASAFTYSLVTLVQKQRIEAELQPHFSACSEASLRSPEMAGTLARALGADALVYGRAVSAEQRFDVTAYLGDRYGLFPVPATFVNRGVNLDEPEAAVFGQTTHAALLGVVAASYEAAGKFAECVEATVAAEQVGGSLPRALEELRGRCQARTGAAALLHGNGGQP